ncbi:hypothetical protein SRABI106_01169 [Rahnella aquatilis]|nr:hypothetical protein SRABI106_01169 [Rahnella aquatilis]
MQTAFLTNGGNTITTTGQNFVRIGLMADIPDNVVERRVIDIMHRHGQFNRPQTGRKVSAGLTDAGQ